MKSPYSFGIGVASILGTCLSFSPARAQEEVPEETPVVKVYDLSKFLLAAHDYPLPPPLPAAAADTSFLLAGLRSRHTDGWGGGGGGLGGGGGGLGGGGGGGAPLRMQGGGLAELPNEYRPPTKPIPLLAIDSDGLIESIENAVEPDSWEEDGGEGTAEALGTQLVVYNLPSIHAKLEKLFEELVLRFPAKTSVRVRIVWLLPDEEVAGEYRSGSPVPIERLRADIETGPFFLTETTCLDGQTVYLVSGDQTPMLLDETPVLTAEASAIDPAIYPVQLGASVQVTPMLDANGKSARVRISGAFGDAKTTPGEGPSQALTGEFFASEYGSLTPVKPGQPTTVTRMSYRPNEPGETPRELALVVQLFVESD